MSSKLLSVVLMNNASMWHLNREGPFFAVKGEARLGGSFARHAGVCPFETDGADISGALALTCHAILSIIWAARTSGALLFCRRRRQLRRLTQFPYSDFFGQTAAVLELSWPWCIIGGRLPMEAGSVSRPTPNRLRYTPTRHLQERPPGPGGALRFPLGPLR